METQDESAGGTKEQCKTGNAFIRAVKGGQSGCPETRHHIPKQPYLPHT